MSTTFWTCLNCNEAVESRFEVCWNCQHDRTGIVPSNFTDFEIHDYELKAPLNTITANKFCLACQNDLTYVGTKRFHSGPYAGPLWTELLSPSTVLEMFYCPACGRVEFFVKPTDFGQ
jgi:hypothetical protein